MFRIVWLAAALAAMSIVDGASAQAPTPPPAATIQPSATIAPPKSAPADGDRTDKAVAPQANAPKAVPTSKSSGAKKPVVATGQPNCTRLPLSDIQFTQEKTTEVARMRLGEYAQKVATQRGWKGFRKSDETVSCEVYLYLGPLGTEYKCLVTATFCPTPGVTTAAKSPAAATAAPAAKPASVATAPSAAPASVAPKAAPASAAVAVVPSTAAATTPLPVTPKPAP